MEILSRCWQKRGDSVQKKRFQEGGFGTLLKIGPSQGKDVTITSGPGSQRKIFNPVGKTKENS